ncbi:ephrin-4-like isoform X2 [Crassostrea virginica]
MFLFLFPNKMQWKLSSTVLPLFILWDVTCLTYATATHHVFYWNRTNPLFSQSNSEINVQLEDSIDFRCPHYPYSTSSNQYEYYLVYIVTFEEYSQCRLKSPFTGTLVINCSDPNSEQYFTILIRRFQSVPGMIDFPPGKYYFMTTSTGYLDGINNQENGACRSNNMRLVMTVKTPDSPTPAPTQAPSNSSGGPVPPTTTTSTTTTTTPKPVTPSPSTPTPAPTTSTVKLTTTSISTTTKFKEKPIDPSKENVIDATGTSKNTGTINSASRTLCFSRTLLLMPFLTLILLLR